MWRALATTAGLALAGCAGSGPAAPTTATTTPTTPAPAAASPAPAATSPAPAAAPVAATPSKEPVVPGVGLDIAGLDAAVSPCADFSEYVNGKWSRNTPIPAAESYWGNFNLVQERNQAIMRQILDEAAATKGAKPGSNLQKVGDYYATAMDSAAINRAGLAPLQGEIYRIMSAKTKAALVPVIARHQQLGTNAFVNIDVQPDAKNSVKYAAYLSQGGLGMGDRDYYLKNDSRSVAVRTAYRTYLTNTFKLLGDDPTTAPVSTETVMRLETRLAQASRSKEDLRDPLANYNKLTVAQLQKQYPTLMPVQLLKSANMALAQEVIVGQPDFVKEVEAVLKSASLPDLKTYLRSHLVTALSSALPQKFVDERFRYSQAVYGVKQQQPRWKRMLNATDRALGEASGQLYVDRAFPPAAKERMLVLVENLRSAYAEKIQAADWMAPATKVQALEKLKAFAVKIGYPDKWKDYSALNISRQSYLQNVVNARIWESNRQAKKLGQPIDRQEWDMTPPTVNAYYNPLMNEIVFPAGILQPPFFDLNADDAVIYGGIGAVIGHEMTHGFDDEGRQYDAKGNLRDWWTKEDAEKFNQRAALVSTQYSAFSPFDSVYVNGKLTMGENLADLGGVTIAYAALQKQLMNKRMMKLDGFTPAQRFFIAYAQNWRSNARPEALKDQMKTDPHSPDQYRTLGPLQNFPEFYEAFGCKPGDKMMRAEAQRAKIW